tara:strand:+ start:30 stop:680 length:651 start_codon:yes stop_codon:yes gene_type:complete
MWRGLASLLAKMALRKKNQGIIDLLLRKRDLKNFKEFQKPGIDIKSSRLDPIPHFINWKDTKKPLNVNLWRGASNVPTESLKSSNLHGLGPESGGWWTNQVMKALDYAEGAPLRISSYGKNYKPQDNLGVLRRGKFTGSTEDLLDVNLLNTYVQGPQVNLPSGVINEKMSLIPSIIARMKMRPEFKQTSLINYIKKILKQHKGDWRFYNRGGIVSL